MSEKILPCPLCGKGFIKNLINAYEHVNEECILHGFEISNETLLKQWNTRKQIDDIVERLEDNIKRCDYCEKEFEGSIVKVSLSEKWFGKKCSYKTAIEIVKEVINK